LGVATKTFTRTLPAVFLASIFCCPLTAEEVVNVGGDVFHLASSGSADEGSIKEFVPADETIDNWSTLVAVRYLKNPRSPEEYIRNMAQEYQDVMPHMQFSVSQLDQTDAWDIDFIMYDRGKTSGFVEWNYFRAERPDVGEGVVVHQYVVRRPYSRSISEAFDGWNLPSFRKRILPVLKQAEFRIDDGEARAEEDEQ